MYNFCVASVVYAVAGLQQQQHLMWECLTCLRTHWALPVKCYGYAFVTELSHINCHCIQYANKRRKRATLIWCCCCSRLFHLLFRQTVVSLCVCSLHPITATSRAIPLAPCVCMCVLKLSRHTKLCDCCNSSLALHWKFIIEHMFWNVDLFQPMLDVNLSLSPTFYLCFLVLFPSSLIHSLSRSLSECVCLCRSMTILNSQKQ